MILTKFDPRALDAAKGTASWKKHQPCNPPSTSTTSETRLKLEHLGLYRRENEGKGPSRG